MSTIDLLDYSICKDKLVVRFVPEDSSCFRKITGNRIYVYSVLFLNRIMFVSYYVKFNDKCYAFVTCDMVNRWGVDNDELYRDAIKSSYMLWPYKFRRIRDIIAESNCSMPLQDADDHEIYVLTTENITFGAVAILYPAILKSISRVLRSNFYVIPSSIHEVLIAPKYENINKEDINSIITEVNKTLDPRDVLGSEALLCDYWSSLKEDSI